MFPQFTVPAFFGISTAALVSYAVIGTGFGALHYFNYEKGGLGVARIGFGTGIILGIVKEKFGLIGSMATHMTSNLCMGLLDKYQPTFLESPLEKEVRLKNHNKCLKRLTGRVARKRFLNR